MDKYLIETRLSGALIKPTWSVQITPITSKNAHTLKPGEWIWDDYLECLRIYEEPSIFVFEFVQNPTREGRFYMCEQEV